MTDAYNLGKDVRGRALWRIVHDDGTEEVIATSKQSVELMDEITTRYAESLRRLADR